MSSLLSLAACAECSHLSPHLCSHLSPDDVSPDDLALLEHLSPHHRLPHPFSRDDESPDDLALLEGALACSGLDLLLLIRALTLLC